MNDNKRQPREEVKTMKDLLTVEEAAKYLTLSINTLNSWRSKKQGPAYIRIGSSVRYSRGDLDKYLRENSVDAISGDNLGEYRLLDAKKNYVIAGANFDLTLEEIDEYLNNSVSRLVEKELKGRKKK
jgi:excisionase family DNA binding protein